MENEDINSICESRNDTPNDLARALLKNYEPRLLEAEDGLQDLT